MFLMYARLYYILFRAHRRLVSLDASSSANPSGGSDSRQLGDAPAVAVRHTRRLKRVSRGLLS